MAAHRSSSFTVIPHLPSTRPLGLCLIFIYRPAYANSILPLVLKSYTLYALSATRQQSLIKDLIGLETTERTPPLLETRFFSISQPRRDARRQQDNACSKQDSHVTGAYTRSRVRAHEIMISLIHTQIQASHVLRVLSFLRSHVIHV